MSDFPTATLLRDPIEALILKIRDPNTGEYKPAAEWVGTYTLPNGSKIPAVFVSGAKQVPSDWTVEGIECVIQDVPSVAPIPQTLNGVIQVQTWRVRFTNYGLQENTVFPNTLKDIAFQMGRLYSAGRQEYQSRTSATYENLIITVPIHNLLPALR